MTDLPLSILTLGPDDVAFVRAPQGIDAAGISQLTQVLQTAFRPDQMKRVIVIPHDMDVTKVEARPLKVPFVQSRPGAQTPSRAKDSDAGYDLYAYDSVWIKPGERVVIDTGIAMAIPQGWYGSIRDRSGLAAKQGLTVLGGVVDSGYRGSVGVILYNTQQGDETRAVYIEKGARIAQMVFERCADVELEQVGVLESTDRGAGGFGSTGL